jgi:hypothetical protein
MRMAATKMSRAKTQRRKEMFLFFTVKIAPLALTLFPHLGGDRVVVERAGM